MSQVRQELASLLALPIYLQKYQQKLKEVTHMKLTLSTKLKTSDCRKHRTNKKRWYQFEDVCLREIYFLFFFFSILPNLMVCGWTRLQVALTSRA